jgi:hypothetical protein
VDPGQTPKSGVFRDDRTVALSSNLALLVTQVCHPGKRRFLAFVRDPRW